MAEERFSRLRTPRVCHSLWGRALAWQKCWAGLGWPSSAVAVSGGRIACHLVRCGVRELTLIDPKKYRPESLLTNECDVHAVGRDKAVVTGKLCLRIRNDVNVGVGVCGIQDLPLAVLARMDIVVLATDNLPAERETGQRCMWLGKPLVHGALHGDTLTAVVRFFSNASRQGPCPACLYGPKEWLEHDSNARRHSCDGTLVDASVESTGTQPTRSLSYLWSLTADLVVNQIVRPAIGLGRPVADTMIEYNGYTHRTVITPLRVNTARRYEHLRYAVLESRKSLGECSVRELTGMATAAVDSPDLLFGVCGMEWIEQAICKCGLASYPKAFVRIGKSAVAVCQGCGRAM